MNDACIHIEHDWRTIPGFLFMSNPPQQKLTCASCGATSMRRVVEGTTRGSRDDRTLLDRPVRE